MYKQFVGGKYNKLEALCKKLENYGYDYFYEVDDEEIEEVWANNDYIGWTKSGEPIFI